MQSQRAQILVRDLGSINGLVGDTQGNLFAAQSPTGKIVRITPEGKVSDFATIEGTPVACAFDPDQGLLVVDCRRAAVWHLNISGQMRIAADRCDRRVFWSPDDVAPEPDGGFYLTDPADSKLDRRVGAIYHVAPDRAVRRVAEQLAGPTGLAFIADRSALAIADSLTHRLMYLYRRPDATLSEPQTFCQLPAIGRGPDGLCYDMDDQLYVAVRNSGKVFVVDPAGLINEQIETGQPDPCSVCFAGPGRRTLYIADATTGVISQIERDVPGLAGIHHSDGLSLSSTAESSGSAWRKALDANESESAN
jgi:gluconolactonase